MAPFFDPPHIEVPEQFKKVATPTQNETAPLQAPLSHVPREGCKTNICRLARTAPPRAYAKRGGEAVRAPPLCPASISASQKTPKTTRHGQLQPAKIVHTFEPTAGRTCRTGLHNVTPSFRLLIPSTARATSAHDLASYNTDKTTRVAAKEPCCCGRKWAQIRTAFFEKKHSEPPQTFTRTGLPSSARPFASSRQPDATKTLTTQMGQAWHIRTIINKSQTKMQKRFAAFASELLPRQT